MPNQNPHNAPWRPLIICMPLLMLLTIGVEVTIVQSVTANSPNACIGEIKSALIKILFLAAFHTAPTFWLIALASSAHLARSLQDLRMPAAAWTATCLLIGWHLWPPLNNSSPCQ